MNTVNKQFAHPLAEGYGLTADDTHQRYADEFRSANLATSIDKTLPPNSGKAALYALMMAMWAAIIFAGVMAMTFG